ncbi:putative imidazolonepropionase [Lampetra fluviatilis]
MSGDGGGGGVAVRVAQRLLVRGAAQVVVVCRGGQRYLAGADMADVAIVPNGSVVVGRDGDVVAVGPAEEIAAQFEGCSFDQIIDAHGHSVIPGLVDAHTHPVWAGDRVHEFAMKLAGASYLDVHRAGGGIHSTVESTRAAGEPQLLASLCERLRRALRAGTTVVEAKSGYGLELASELRMLRTLERARALLPLKIVSSYCGAHAVPRGRDADGYAEEVVREHLPAVRRLVEDGSLRVELADVFLERGVFERDAARSVLRAARDLGFLLNFHGDEFTDMGAGELAAELGARAVSHLEETSDQGIAAMATARCAAVLLPSTAYVLRLKEPRARAMIDAGVIVALGSDFNPNAYCIAMPVVMNLACVRLRMSLPEALVAATINAAYALGCEERHGSLEPGKQGDMVIIAEPRWEHIIYQLGCHGDIISHVITQGNVVYEK